MHETVQALSDALDALREKLISTNPTDPGFAAMRGVYLQLTKALVIAGDRVDAEMAKELVLASRAAVEEWGGHWRNPSGWLDVLQPVIAAVDSILEASGQRNPLQAFIT